MKRGSWVSVFLLVVADPTWADDRIGVDDFHTAVPGIIVEEVLPPVFWESCSDSAFTPDLRCNFVVHASGPDGAMYTVTTDPAPTNALCLEEPCVRTAILRNRATSAYTTLAYFDQRLDSNGLDIHQGAVTGLYIDVANCNLYVRLETSCSALGGCDLDPRSYSVLRLRGLKSPRCLIP